MASCFAKHIIIEKGTYYKTRVITEAEDSRDNGLPWTPQERAGLTEW